MKEFNVNDYVEVKLTDAGLKILEAQHNALLNNLTPEGRETIGDFKIPETNEEGYTRFQFWQLMQAFGNYMYMGNTNIPFETNIRISDEYLVEKAPEQSRSK